MEISHPQGHLGGRTSKRGTEAQIGPRRERGAHRARRDTVPCGREIEVVGLPGSERRGRARPFILKSAPPRLGNPRFPIPSYTEGAACPFRPIPSFDSQQPASKTLRVFSSGCWESNPVYLYPKQAYYRYTTARLRHAEAMWLRQGNARNIVVTAKAGFAKVSAGRPVLLSDSNFTLSYFCFRINAKADLSLPVVQWIERGTSNP
jgi:hypothetical protein